ncbi:MAG: hypothetical protein ACAI43_11420 [Phycisphaerae bacterium]
MLIKPTVSFRAEYATAAGLPTDRTRTETAAAPTVPATAARAVADQAVLVPSKIPDLLRFESTADHVGRASQFKSVATSVGRALQFAGPPILGQFQAERYDAMRAVMSDVDLFQIDLLLGNAGSDTERAYLKKALVAGNTGYDLDWFAEQIRGKDPSWLRANLRLVNDSKEGSKGLTQQWANGGAPAAAQVIRGELDPVFALRVRQGNADVTAIDPTSNLAVGQAQMLGAAGSTYSTMSPRDAINILGYPGTGLVYTTRNGYRNTAVIDVINRDIAVGVPVAIRLDDQDVGDHVLVITGYIGPDPRIRDPYAKVTYVAHDPRDGRTVFLDRHQLALDTQFGAPNGISELYARP